MNMRFCTVGLVALSVAKVTVLFVGGYDPDQLMYCAVLAVGIVLVQ